MPLTLVPQNFVVLQELDPSFPIVTVGHLSFAAFPPMPLELDTLVGGCTGPNHVEDADKHAKVIGALEAGTFKGENQ